MRVLFVDDEQSILDVVSGTLEDWARERRVELVLVRSAAAALEYLEREAGTVNIVVSDQQMPGMRGTELFRRIRERWPGIMTILHSGHSEISEVAVAVQERIFSFLPKPAPRRLLEQELDKALELQALRDENRRYVGRIQEELRWAGELQQALFRLDLPEPSTVDFDVTYLPLAHLQCSGDFYDVVPLDGDRYLCIIGDVAGHGVKAALLTFYIRAAIRTGYLASGRRVSPDDLLTWLNQRMCRELTNLPSVLVTCVACVLEPAEGSADLVRLTFSNGGHLPIFIVHGGIVEALRMGGPGIGFSPDSRYQRGVRDLAPGDRIVLHTDGLRELGRDNLLDQAAFAAILASSQSREDFNAAILEQVRGRAGPAGFQDDAALLTATLSPKQST